MRSEASDLRRPLVSDVGVCQLDGDVVGQFQRASLDSPRKGPDRMWGREADLGQLRAVQECECTDHRYGGGETEGSQGGCTEGICPDRLERGFGRYGHFGQ